MSRAHGAGRPGHALAIVLGALLTVWTFCTLAMATVFVAGGWLTGWDLLARFPGPQSAQVLGILALAILPVTTIYILAEALKGLERIALSQLVYSWVLLGPVVIWLLLLPEREAIGAVELARAFTLWAWIVAGLLVLPVLGMALSGLRASRGARGPRPVRPDLSSLRAMFLIRPVTLATNWMPIWLLSGLAGVEAAGAYAVANRLAAAIALGAVAVEATFAARLARETLRARALADLRRLQAVSLALSAGIGLVLFAGAETILDTMGEAFTSTALGMFHILILAYVINGYFAPLGTFALMRGREGQALLTYGAVLVVTTCAVAVTAIPVPGTGPALAVLCAFVIRGLMFELFLLRDR